ncbi:RNA polymerase sigma70 [Sphingobium sp. C100]|uniref:RNA polymerase sigma factor n=1 Tax=Sphingobium sp. C100 TaxID=1207055 RepID=UPI0003D6798C|nr:RNA polymerase sigma factor [Sphingobium sp. C100]ETI64525.1 RNA polymerase sigma70 [Sphingobium sp. C100]
MSFERDLLAILPRLRRFAASLSRDRADGDDLCQAAVERALKARDQWQPGTRLDSWIYRIMRNLWIDEARARQRAARTFAPEEAGAGVGHAGDRDVEAHMALADVDRAMQALPDEQREAIALVLVDGMSYREAAELLGIPMGTLTSRLVRGRGALIELMGEAA